MVYRLRLLFVAVSLVAFVSCSRCTLPSASSSQAVRILSYNVENLFDDVDDGTEYPEYDPGTDAWSSDLYHARLANLAAVVKASTEGGPDILVLEEVESERVLQDLTTMYLSDLRYQHSVIGQEEDSAIHVAILTRTPVNCVIAHRSVVHGQSLRCMLEVHVAVGRSELVLFCCHWKSKSGSAEYTEPLRVESAALLSERIRRLMAQSSDCEVVVAGDLNEQDSEYEGSGMAYQTALLPAEGEVPAEYEGRSLFVSYDPERAGVVGSRLTLYSPWETQDWPGSYSYQGNWERIDHFLLGPGLLDTKGLRVEAFEVIHRDFMLDEEQLPVRWNTRLARGYSDHLPIMLTVGPALDVLKRGDGIID